jgi:hypothetical protein
VANSIHVNPARTTALGQLRGLTANREPRTANRE